jgi:hypothetical protein
LYRQLKTPETAGTWDIGCRLEASSVHAMSVDTGTTHIVAHTVNRLVIDTDTSFDEVLERYESLVPAVDFAKLTRLVFNGDLSRVKRYTDELAPHSLRSRMNTALSLPRTSPLPLASARLTVGAVSVRDTWRS